MGFLPSHSSILNAAAKGLSTTYEGQVCWICAFRLRRGEERVMNAPVHAALPLHIKYPKLQTQSGPDGQVSVVTGVPKIRIEAVRCTMQAKRETAGVKGQSFAERCPGNCWQKHGAVGVWPLARLAQMMLLQPKVGGSEWIGKTDWEWRELMVGED